MFPLLLLPVELLLRVCSNLPRRDLDRVQMVNRQMNKIVKRYKRDFETLPVTLNIRVFDNGAILYQIASPRIGGRPREEFTVNLKGTKICGYF